MTHNEIQTLLRACLRRKSRSFQPPSDDEWKSLERRFSCEFPTEMRDFIDLMSEFAFPGDILNVGFGPNNGNDSIEFVFNFEAKENPAWLAEMIPFFSIGNGDYFCVSSREGVSTAVYYYYADRSEFEKYCSSFSIWLEQLPKFLA